MPAFSNEGGRRGWARARWSAIGLILLLPAVAMRFTPQVHWTVFDFLAAALLLGGAELVYEAASRDRAGRTRICIAAGITAVVAVIWAQGAVGVF